MTTPTLGGSTVTRARVQIGAWGFPWIDVDLGDAVDLTGAQLLELGETKIACSVVSGGKSDGTSRYHLIGGAGGWAKEIGEKGYADDLGIKVSTVVGDAAKTVGETVEGAPSTRRGPYFDRPRGRAVWVLHAVAPNAWYVDLDGVTRFGSRPESPYAGEGAIGSVGAGGRSTVISALSPADLAGILPGVNVKGRGPAFDVEWRIEGADVSATVYHAPEGSRALVAFEQILDAIDPLRRFAGSWEYRVLGQANERLDLEPARVSSGMAPLDRVVVRPGMAGLRSTLVDGCSVVVSFLDRDPSRPFVYAFDEAGSEGWLPLAFMVGDDPCKPAARMTDPVVCGPFTGVITQGSSLASIGG